MVYRSASPMVARPISGDAVISRRIERRLGVSGTGRVKNGDHWIVTGVRAEIRYRQRALDSHDVTLAHGLPTMTIKRAIADLVEEPVDLSLVADAFRDAARRRSLLVDRLHELLAPLANRNGLTRGDGNALLNRLLKIAGIDPDTVARRVATIRAAPRVATDDRA